MYLQFDCNRLFLLLYLLLFLKKVTPVLVTDLFFAFERIMSSFLFSENNLQVSHIFFWEKFSKKTESLPQCERRRRWKMFKVFEGTDKKCQNV